jgi:hypothetical protein
MRLTKRKRLLGSRHSVGSETEKETEQWSRIHSVEESLQEAVIHSEAKPTLPPEGKEKAQERDGQKERGKEIEQ